MTKRTPLQILRRKRSDAKRSIAVAKKRIEQLENSIIEIESEMEKIVGSTPCEWTDTHAPRLPFRANGEMQRALISLLRERKRATAADLATVMLKAKGIDPANAQAAWAMRQRCIQAFRRCYRAGLVLHVAGVGKGGRFKIWELAPIPASVAKPISPTPAS